MMSNLSVTASSVSLTTGKGRKSVVISSGMFPSPNKPSKMGDEKEKKALRT